ncbi:MAG TPA: carbon-nitrogen hydrolase family protein [Steroidobacteraceae bacterium]|nr:carbon-nitrogen hydrolase family protein [Steroidobacteraceae bacterium]
MTTVAAIQMTSGPDVAANLAVAGPLLAQARTAGATVALLPENFNFIGRRDADKRTVAEVFGSGATQDFLTHSAAALGLWIIAGTQPLAGPDKDGRVTNSTLVYDASGRCVARYDKIHLFDVDVPDKPKESYRESAGVAPGREVVLIDTPAGRVGLSVCYDVRFPELYRRLSAAGAEILVVPSAFTVPTGRAHWETLLRARAIENLCYVVAAAQSGVHPSGRETYGDSLIVDYWGRVLSRLPRGSGVITADIDRAAMATTRTGFPSLAHRVFNP